MLYELLDLWWVCTCIYSLHLATFWVASASDEQWTYSVYLSMCFSLKGKSPLTAGYWQRVGVVRSSPSISCSRSWDIWSHAVHSPRKKTARVIWFAVHSARVLLTKQGKLISTCLYPVIANLGHMTVLIWCMSFSHTVQNASFVYPLSPISLSLSKQGSVPFS